MATKEQMEELYGVTHTITRVPLPRNGEVRLDRLAPGQSVAKGDGKTFYWLLEEKPAPNA